MNPQDYDKKLIGFGLMLMVVFIGIYILSALNILLDKPKVIEFEPLAEVKETEVYQLSKDYDKSQYDKLDTVRDYYFNKYITITPTPTPEPIIEREAYRKEVTPTPTATPTPSPTPIPTSTPIPTPVPMGRNQQLIWSLNAQELDMLARIARAECGGESVESMACIICMVLNRVRDPYFPNTVQGVIYSPNQFTPVRIGTFDVPATPQAWQAIELVKNGFDPSNGATYFSSGKSQWHWNSLTFVGTYGKIYMFK